MLQKTEINKINNYYVKTRYKWICISTFLIDFSKPSLPSSDQRNSEKNGKYVYERNV